MGIFTLIFALPVLPVYGVIKLGEVVERRVDEETRSPVALRRELERLDRARAEGEISEQDAALEQSRVLDRVLGTASGPDGGNSR